MRNKAIPEPSISSETKLSLPPRNPTNKPSSERTQTGNLEPSPPHNFTSEPKISGSTPMTLEIQATPMLYPKIYSKNLFKSQTLKRKLQDLSMESLPKINPPSKKSGALLWYPRLEEKTLLPFLLIHQILNTYTIWNALAGFIHNLQKTSK